MCGDDIKKRGCELGKGHQKELEGKNNGKDTNPVLT